MSHLKMLTNIKTAALDNCATAFANRGTAVAMSAAKARAIRRLERARANYETASRFLDAAGKHYGPVHAERIRAVENWRFARVRYERAIAKATGVRS